MEDSNGLIFLRARFYDPRQGRFLQRDPWRGISAKPASYNPWLYSYGNPINLIDPSGKAPQCDRYQRADLTQWLVDEMNENRKSNIFLILWTAVHTPELIDTLVPGPIEVNLPPELTSYGIALGLFADVVKPHGLWDFKNAIFDLIGRNIQLTSRWYRYDAPINVYFGFIGLAIGFDKTILHCGADYATNGIPCSGSDPLEDYEAIEAGYDIYKQSGWGQVDENMVRTALLKHQLIAGGKKTEPNLDSYSFPWPYAVGTFDNGSSGWIIKHR
jgi:RHS repeat-associated protein